MNENINWRKHVICSAHWNSGKRENKNQLLDIICTKKYAANLENEYSQKRNVSKLGTAFKKVFSKVREMVILFIIPLIFFLACERAEFSKSCNLIGSGSGRKFSILPAHGAIPPG